MEAVIFIGVQGSGKSTFYREQFFDRYVRISLDLLRTRHRQQRFLEVCLATQQRFVIDNTNSKVTERAPYIAASKAARFRVTGYFFQTLLGDALRRNAQRTGKQFVPVRGIISTFKRLQKPTLDEGFDQLHAVTINSENRFVVSSLE
ncbi:MAG: AAA family ATPase [Acidobacteriaceae bacterium]|nr:AAA family ATPase [Acidobacteriaceae bacterium]